MHQWGDKDKDGNDICAKVSDAADYIGTILMATDPMIVRQVKEKFGTVRIYCAKPMNSYNRKLYKKAYEVGLKLWPELKEEILCCADWPELLKEVG